MRCEGGLRAVGIALPSVRDAAYALHMSSRDDAGGAACSQCVAETAQEDLEEIGKIREEALDQKSGKSVNSEMRTILGS